MMILAAATNQIRNNDILIKAVGLDPDKLIADMNENAGLYNEAFACGQAGRELRFEADRLEEGAHEEFGAPHREIARLLGLVAYNLNARIRYEQEPDPVR